MFQLGFRISLQVSLFKAYRPHCPTADPVGIRLQAHWWGEKKRQLKTRMRERGKWKRRIWVCICGNRQHNWRLLRPSSTNLSEAVCLSITTEKDQLCSCNDWKRGWHWWVPCLKLCKTNTRLLGRVTRRRYGYYAASFRVFTVITLSDEPKYLFMEAARLVVAKHQAQKLFQHSFSLLLNKEVICSGQPCHPAVPG